VQGSKWGSKTTRLNRLGIPQIEMGPFLFCGSSESRPHHFASNEAVAGFPGSSDVSCAGGPHVGTVGATTAIPRTDFS
jgi:hypothetical protein